MKRFNVAAHWDAEAKVWWAESTDIPGFAAEAATHDALVAEIRQLVPELLALNLPGVEPHRYHVHLVSDQIEEFCEP